MDRFAVGWIVGAVFMTVITIIMIEFSVKDGPEWCQDFLAEQKAEAEAEVERWGN